MRRRAATMQDLPALRELIPLSVRGLSGDCYSREQIESAIRYVFGADSQLIADGTYYVVESSSGLVGCGGWSRRRTLYGGDQMKGSDDPLLDPMIDAARIRAFFVHPEWARRGIASQIVTQCIEAARSAGFERFEIVATLPGERLYQRFGFKSVERFETELPDGVTITFVRMHSSVTELASVGA